MPVSSGPLAKVARLRFDVPAPVSAGASLTVSATITSTSAMPRVITTPATSALLVVRDSQIVGAAHGGSAPEVPLELSAGAARPAQAIPRSVRLTACGAASPALTAGQYSLVAVLGYRIDSLNMAPNDGSVPPQASGRPFLLVSAPMPITVN